MFKNKSKLFIGSLAKMNSHAINCSSIVSRVLQDHEETENEEFSDKEEKDIQEINEETVLFQGGRKYQPRPCICCGELHWLCQFQNSELSSQKRRDGCWSIRNLGVQNVFHLFMGWRNVQPEMTCVPFVAQV